MQDLQRLFEFIKKAALGGFFGTLTITFQNGKIHTVKTERTQKLEEL